MLNFPGTLPVRTRLPFAAWAVAGAVALFSLVSTLLHIPTPSNHAMPRAEQGAAPLDALHQAKV